jgi:hypothetical protein
MTTLVIPDTVQVAIEAVASGQPVWNVLHFKMGGATPSPASFLATVKTAWEATNGPCKAHTTAYVMVGYHYTDLSSATGAVAFLGSTTTGALSAALSTMASAALIKLSTGTRSRSQQGRLYHGPLAESQINADGRTLDSTYATSIAAAYTQFLFAIDVGTITWAVASRKLLSSTSITSTGIATVIATQRRRLR